MIDKKDYKLLIDIAYNNRLDYNNFKTISDKSLNDSKKYCSSLDNFLTELEKHTLKNNI